MARRKKFLALVALLLSLACLLDAQIATVKRDGDDSYVLRLRRVTEESNACVLLRRDGHYHYERVLPSKAIIYEGSLSSGDLQQIQSLVSNDELRGLNQDEIPLHLAAPSLDELDLP